MATQPHAIRKTCQQAASRDKNSRFCFAHLGVGCLREDMREKSLQKIFPAFGTVNSITLYDGAGPGIAEHIKKRSLELHRRFSFFEPGIDIFRINEQAGGHPVPVHPDTLFVLSHALDYGRKVH